MGDAVGRSALMWALSQQADEASLALIETGCNLAHTDADGRSCLQAAAFLNKPELVAAMLDNGADIDQSVRCPDGASVAFAFLRSQFLHNVVLPLNPPLPHIKPRTTMG